MSERTKALGRRGSWFAMIDGETLPCVHRHWMRGLGYDDRFADMTKPEWQEFGAAIADKRKVILTKDEVTPSEQAEVQPPSFRRLGHIDTCAVDGVRVEGRHVRFRFVKRVGQVA